jgi:hypothetical protein
MQHRRVLSSQLQQLPQIVPRSTMLARRKGPLGPGKQGIHIHGRLSGIRPALAIWPLPVQRVERHMAVADLPPALPSLATAHLLSADVLIRRGTILLPEGLADLALLAPAGRAASVSGLTGTLVTLDGLRLAPAADGRVDLSLLPVGWFDGAQLIAGPAGAALGAGALAGQLDLQMAPVNAGGRAWMAAGSQARRGIAAIDLRLGDEFGWIGGGFTEGGALSTPGGLAATGQRRWHLGARFSQDVGASELSGRALLSSRREGAERADFHDLALRLRGGTRWQWAVAVGTGGHQGDTIATRQTLVSARVDGDTGMVLPGASEPVRLTMGSEMRRLRLGAVDGQAHEVFGLAVVPVIQDRPAAENLTAVLGVRQAWISGRRETMWQAGGRWEFFPGITLRGQVARSVDDLGAGSGTGRSVGVLATPAFVPVVLAVDWRSQDIGLARVRALDLSALWQHRLGGTAQLVVEAMATHHQQADTTAVPVARFQSLLRARVNRDGWTVTAGWRHRSVLAGGAARHWLDLGVEHQVAKHIRLIASIGNAGDAGSGAGPVGRQALLQLVAGF